MSEDATLSDFIEDAAQGGDEKVDEHDGSDEAGGEYEHDGVSDGENGIERDGVEESGDEETDDDRGDEVNVPETTAEEPAITYRWEPDLECPDCGRRVSRLWRNDGTSVCEECKPW